jgi:hypothetical protein
MYSDGREGTNQRHKQSRLLLSDSCLVLSTCKSGWLSIPTPIEQCLTKEREKDRRKEGRKEGIKEGR